MFAVAANWFNWMTDHNVIIKYQSETLANNNAMKNGQRLLEWPYHNKKKHPEWIFQVKPELKEVALAELMKEPAITIVQLLEEYKDDKLILCWLTVKTKRENLMLLEKRAPLWLISIEQQMSPQLTM